MLSGISDITVVVVDANEGPAYVVVTHADTGNGHHRSWGIERIHRETRSRGYNIMIISVHYKRTYLQ